MPPKRSSKQRGSNASVTSTSVLSRADRRKIISQKRSAPPRRIVASTTKNDADGSSPLSTATTGRMSPGIPPMNDVALLRNLSKLNVYDVAGQHSDDKEYAEGIPLATVVEDAIDNDGDGGVSALLLSLLQLSLNSTSIG